MVRKQIPFYSYGSMTNTKNFITKTVKLPMKSNLANFIVLCVGFAIVFLKIPPLVLRAQKVNDTHHVISFRGQPSYFTAYLFRIATTSITIRMSSPCHLLLQKKNMVQAAFASLIVPIAFEAISWVASPEKELLQQTDGVL